MGKVKESQWFFVFFLKLSNRNGGGGGGVSVQRSTGFTVSLY